MAKTAGVRAKKFVPSVTVIMPVLNEESHLEASVNSILSQSYPTDIELILALGPSHDETNSIAKALAKNDKRIKLLDNPRGLTTVGLNAAIKIAKHDYIVRIDAHSEPAENYLQDGIRILIEQEADEVGGIMHAQGRSAFQKAVAYAYTSRWGIGGASYHVGGQAGEAESAYLGIFKKSALERVGGYDEAIIRGEDWDLAQRIKRTGGKVWFSPELKVTYWPRGRFDRLVKQFYSTGVWRGDLTRRDIGGASKRYFMPPLLVLGILLGLVLLAFGQLIGVIPAAAYLLGITLVAILAAGLSLKSRAALIIALATMHLSWGWGFIRGFIRGATGTIDKSRVRG
ncbi:MAG: glycosyltransferase family 2 protein [Rhodoluna sp.]|nr:glycosyltransferase family 2 protein [Rhodoluna sp.]